MLFLENINLAITSLLSNKMRALLTMLGIIIGIAAVIAILTVGNSLTLYVSQSMQEMGANDIYAMVTNKDTDKEEYSNSGVDGIKFGKLTSSEDMSEDDYITDEMIKEMCNRFDDEIYAVNLYRQSSIGTAKYEQKTDKTRIIGTSVGYFVTYKLDFVAGSMFSQKDFEEKRHVTIIPDKLAESLFGENVEQALGKEISVTVDNDEIKYTVIGVYDADSNQNAQQAQMGNSMGAGGFGMTANFIYIPLKTFNADSNAQPLYPYIQIITKVGVDPEELSSRITDFFEPYYRTNRSFTISAFTLGSMTGMLTDMLGVITKAISIVASIALLVGGIGVMNIMLVSVTERTKEIGTRKALGAKNSSIRMQFIVEAVIICLIGGFIGVIVGILSGMGLANALGYPAFPSISGIIISLLFSMTIGIFFGYYPANKAAKMNPIDALRYE